MAVTVLTNPNTTMTDPGLDINDPIVVAAQELRHNERHNQNELGEKLDPPRDEVQWTIPPVSSASPEAQPDFSISLEIGVVYEIRPGDETMFQNISDNEDDRVEFSTHGNANGTWAKLNAGSILQTDQNFFMLNRTSFENLRIAVIEPAV
jgi:hypothetical protein